MGSVPPARRFDAHRVFAVRSLPSRLAPDGGPPCAFALLQRSIAAPPHRPVDPRADSSDDASFPGLSCRTTRAGKPGPFPRGVRPRGVPRPGFDPPSRFRPTSLRTPCGARASFGFTLQGLLLASIGTPLGAHGPRGVARVGSPRSSGERADAVDFRASVPARMRSVDRIPKDPIRRCLPGLLPSERSPSPTWNPAFGRRTSPRTRGRGAVAPRPGHRVSSFGEMGWPLSGLPALLGFRHLSTVAATQRPARRAGS
jgi:hypothetical protein